MFDRIVAQLGYSTDITYDKELLEETIKGTLVETNNLENYVYYNLYRILSPTKLSNMKKDEYYFSPDIFYADGSTYDVGLGTSTGGMTKTMYLRMLTK